MKVLIIGNFGYSTDLVGGQTIKTRHIYDLYKSKLGTHNVRYFDVDALNENKLLILSLFNDLSKVEEIIIVPGRRFLTSIFPFIAQVNRVFNKPIHVFAVGGWMASFLTENKKIIKHLAKVENIFVESKALKTALRQQFHFSNVVVFPNFRMHDFNHISANSPDKLRLVFMARVNVEKGILILFRLFDYLQQHPEKFEKNVSLDIYGPIDKAFESQFISGIKAYEQVNYRGVVEFDNVFETLNQYDVAVLPTFYEGEGFPGTVVDAYISGIPVIVSNWKNLPEFVDHGKTGFVFDLEKFSQLVEYVQYFANNDHELMLMKDKAKLKSLNYSAEIAWKIIQIQYHKDQ